MDKALLVPENNNNLLVRHSNKIAEARYHLTVGEQRLILLMVSMINRKDKDFKDYEIKVTDFFHLLEIKNKDYKRVQIITKSLLSKVLEIEENNSLLQVHWLSSVKYLHNEGVVKLSFDPELKPYLLELKTQFTKYYLSTVIHFRSAYTIRIYQLLKSNEYRGFMDFYYQELREILGIEEEEYPLYKNFRNKVLDQAKKELEEKTHKGGAYKSDLSFKLEVLERKNRKIHKIRFNIVKQTYQEALPLDIQAPESPAPQSPALMALLSHGISEILAEKYLKNNQEENILDTINLYEKKIADGEVKSLGGGYLIKLLDAKAGQKTVYEKQLEEAEKQAIIDSKREVQEKIKVEKEEAEKKEKQNKVLEDYFKNLDSAEQDKIVQELVSTLEGFDKKFYHKKGLAHPAISYKLKQLLKKKIAKNKTIKPPLETPQEQKIVGKLAQKALRNFGLGDKVPTITTANKKIYPAKYLYQNSEGLMMWHGIGRKPKWINEFLEQGGKLADILIVTA